MQGGQTRPSLVPKNFSRLLPHKAMIGAPFQKRVHDLSECSVGVSRQQYITRTSHHRLGSITDNFPEKEKLGLRFTHVNRSLEFFPSVVRSNCNATQKFLDLSLCCEPRNTFFARGKTSDKNIHSEVRKGPTVMKVISTPQCDGNVELL